MTTLLTKIFGLREFELPEHVQAHKAMKKRLDLRRNIDEADFVAFDTELTGLDFKRDSIISIGAVKLKGGRILPGKSFYRLVSPEAELKPRSVVVHEITHAELEDAEVCRDVLSDFLEFVGDAVLIGHFAFIDENFVNRAMRSSFGITLQNPTIDTLSIHEWLNEHDSRFARHYGGMTLKNDLFAMARRYGIEIEKSHNAFYDAFLTAQLFQRFYYFLRESGVRTLEELIAVGRTLPKGGETGGGIF